MGAAELAQLRLFIDDPMPTDGVSDPQFDDATLQGLLDSVNQHPQKAAVTAWKWKAAQAASLVDVTEGNASRAMSDMVSHALEMVKLYEVAHSGPTDGRTTIGRIKRRRF